MYAFYASNMHLFVLYVSTLPQIVNLLLNKILTNYLLTNYIFLFTNSDCLTQV